MQDSKKIQTQLDKTKLLGELITLINNTLLRVDDEPTAIEIAALFSKYQDKIKVRLNFAAIADVKTDIVSLTAILLTVRQGGLVASIPCLKITYNDGKKYLYRSPNSVTTTKLIALFTALDLPLDLCFFEPSANLEKQSWATQPINKLYRSEITFFYNLVHKAMAEYLIKYLTRMKLNIKPDQLLSNILLISAACGDGSDLKCIKQQLTEYKVSAAGFDINSENVAATKDNLKEGHFFQGDIVDIAKHFVEIKKWFNQVNKNDPQVTVVIFSGILQRALLKGTVEATQYLQLASRCSQLVMMSSIQNTLTTKRIAKAIGFNVNSQNINYTSTKGHPESRILYCLEKQSPDQRLAYLIKKSDKRSPDNSPTNIDLSLSANPLGDFILIMTKHSPRLNTAKQLDLSWSHFAENELDVFIKTISEKLPNLERLLISNVESWAKVLLEMKLPYAIYQRKDVLNEHEVPQFSVPCARFFKLYKSPPVVVVQEKLKITLKKKL